MANNSKRRLTTGGAVALILGAVYAHEGGYVDDPRDRGGATNFGVTEQVARAAGYQGDMRRFPKHCAGQATVCADSIYVRDYIQKPGFMPMVERQPAIAAELVDTAVNTGPSRPLLWYRAAVNGLGGGPLPLNSRPLGAGDYAALAKIEAQKGKVGACVAMLNALDAGQRDFYLRLVQARPSQRVYLNGWLKNRINNVDRRDCSRWSA